MSMFSIAIKKIASAKTYLIPAGAAALGAGVGAMSNDKDRSTHALVGGLTGAAIGGAGVGISKLQKLNRSLKTRSTFDKTDAVKNIEVKPLEKSEKEFSGLPRKKNNKRQSSAGSDKQEYKRSESKNPDVSKKSPESLGSTNFPSHLKTVEEKKVWLADQKAKGKASRSEIVKNKPKELTKEQKKMIFDKWLSEGKINKKQHAEAYKKVGL